MQLSAILFALAVASGAYSTDHMVVVGDSDALVFKPTSLNKVRSGDNVIFEFHSKNHSVTQSSFAAPCTPLPGGVNSGFKNVSTTSPPTFPKWNITIVNASDPFWFYCAQTSPVKHCNSGMVFAINPTQDKSFDNFQATAKTAIVSVPPAGTTSPSNSSVPSSVSSSDGASSTTPSSARPSSAGAPSGTPLPSNPSSAGSFGGSSDSSGGSAGSSGGSAGSSGGSASASGGSPNGTPSSQSANGSGTSAATPSTTNGAARMGGSASGVLALAGLVACLIL